MVIAYKAIGAAVSLALSVSTKTAPFVPVEQAFGHNSSVTTPMVALAKDQAGWDRLWAQHRGTTGANLPSTIRLADDRPPIDFKKYVVVAVFGGTTQGVEGYQVVASAVEGETAFIRLAPVPPPVNLAIPRVAQPYAFVVLPRTQKKLEVQIMVGPERWSKLADFPAEKASGKSRTIP